MEPEEESAPSSWRGAVTRLLAPELVPGEAPHALLIHRFGDVGEEARYQGAVFESRRWRYRASLLLLLVCFSLFLLFSLARGAMTHPMSVAGVTSVAMLVTCAAVACSYSDSCYSRETQAHVQFMASGLLLLLPPAALLAAGVDREHGMEITILSTTALPFAILSHFHLAARIPPLVALPSALLCSALTCLVPLVKNPGFFCWRLCGLLFCFHVTANILLLHLSHNLSARYRSLFREEGTKAEMLRLKEREKVNLENMLMSIMPRDLALQTLADMAREKSSGGDGASHRRVTVNRFRKLKVELKEDVSILFADIVGFTNMSSGKTAAELLLLLNDLYGRFDDLAERCRCEKIATLGDCYYCVAGCVKPQPDNAKCCIDMGLRMIEVIKQFDEDNNESVQMRVGIHSGRVICGIVGERRYKFDILSMDVFAANELESTGQPGRVHISEATLQALGEADRAQFVFTENLDLATRGGHNTCLGRMKTYFVRWKELNRQRTVDDPTSIPHTRRRSAVDRQKSSSLTDLAPPPSDPLVVDGGQGVRRHVTIDVISTTPLNFMLSFKDPELEGRYRRFVTTDALTEAASSQRSSCKSNVYHFLLQTLLFLPVSISLFTEGGVSGTCCAVIGLFLALVVSLSVPTLAPVFSRTDGILRRLRAKMFSYTVYHVITILLLASPVITVILCSLAGPSSQSDSSAGPSSQSDSLAGASSQSHSLAGASGSQSERFMRQVALNTCLLSLANFPGASCVWKAAAGLSLVGLVTLVDGMWATSVDWWLYAVHFAILGVTVLSASLDSEVLLRAVFFCQAEEEDSLREKEVARQRAEIELNNVLPEYIVTHFKKGVTHYSETRPNVAIIFFFVDFFYHYSEDYRSGTEWVRLLNELICDFDDILNHRKFSCIEKIKTISSTYMAASNLNPNSTQGNWKMQAVKLMEFVLEMRRKLHDFCISGFQFGSERETYKYKVGFNYGDITSGVIGTSKLHFDIWGDSVNVASRMYSTAEPDRIQMTEKAKLVLEEEKWGSACFVYRGKVDVKGKGQMDTYYFHQPTKPASS